MPLSFVGAAADLANTVTPPAHVAGDLLLCYAARSAVDSLQVALPAGWTSAASSGATNSHNRLSWRIATGPGTAGGTWTNAQFVVIVVYRGADQLAPVGAVAHGAAPSAAPSFSAVALQRDIGSSWVFGGWLHPTATNVDTPPTGMSLRAALGVGPMFAAFDTAVPVQSFASRGITANASAGWRSIAAEIRREHRALAAGGACGANLALSGAAAIAFPGVRRSGAGSLSARAMLAGHAILNAAPGRLVAVRRRILRLPGRPLFWDAKRPEDRDLFGLDLTPMLSRSDGSTDGLFSVFWDVPAGLVLQAQGRAGNVAVAEISGGVAGTDYALDCLALTQAGRLIKTRVRLPVRAP